MPMWGYGIGREVVRAHASSTRESVSEWIGEVLLSYFYAVNSPFGMLRADVMITVVKYELLIMSLPIIGGGIKRWCCLTSVWRLSRTSGTERPRKTKIGTFVAHVTCDSDTTFKVKRSKSPGRFTHRRVNVSGSCSGERGNVLAVGNYCYVAVCSAAWGASTPTDGWEGRGTSWRTPAYSLL